MKGRRLEVLWSMIHGMRWTRLLQGGRPGRISIGATSISTILARLCVKNFPRLILPEALFQHFLFEFSHAYDSALLEFKPTFCYLGFCLIAQSLKILVKSEAQYFE